MLQRLTIFALLMVCTAGAQATIYATLENTSPSSDGAGGFNWKYDITLAPEATMHVGDKLVIYDFLGLRNLSNLSFAQNGLGSNTFEVTQELSSLPLGPYNPPDNASIPNVILSLKTGPDVAQTSGGPNPPALLLGTLTLDSTIGAAGCAVANGPDCLPYGSFDHQLDVGPPPRLLDRFALSSVAGPVPEPSTVSLIGVGLLGAVAFSIRQRRRSV